MSPTDTMQERSRGLYMNDKEYLEALLRLQGLIISGMALRFEDSDTTGDKYNFCSWGLCSEDIEMWPEPAMHLWPDQFARNGRIAPKYRLAHHKCPMDTRDMPDENGVYRTSEQPGMNGCFWTCIVFRRMERLKVFGSTLVTPSDGNKKFCTEVMKRLNQRIDAARIMVAEGAANAEQHDG